MAELSHHAMTDHLVAVSNDQFAVQTLYERAYRKGQLALIWSAFTRRPHQLQNWADVESTSSLGDCVGIRKERVQIQQIRGSVERFGDFDADFHPLNPQNQERWLKVARALRAGIALPPVKLNQVGDAYYVQDGHHRISVTQSLGYREIEAQVTVYPVNRALPRERPERPAKHKCAGQTFRLIRQRVRRDHRVWVPFFAKVFTPRLRWGPQG